MLISGYANKSFFHILISSQHSIAIGLINCLSQIAYVILLLMQTVQTEKQQSTAVRSNIMQIIDLYERLSTADDERTKARIIADAFAQLHDRYPQLAEVATQTNLKETELKLNKEIEQVRLELTKEIEKVRLELTKEIEKVRLELTKEISKVKSDLIKWSFLFWVTQFGAILAILFKT